MPSLSHCPALTPAKTDASQTPLAPQGWMGTCQTAPCSDPHPSHPQQSYGKQQQDDLLNTGRRTDGHRKVRGVVFQLLLGLGVSLVGSGAIAQTISPTSFPTDLSSLPTIPQPLAQSADETIRGDSEARQPNSSKGSIYSPIRLQSGRNIEDTLTTKDIPMGQGSFARDYVVTLKANDQVAIDLFSDSFDTVVTLMSENGTTLGENDDGPDGGTNSLLFMRITDDGDYVVRVRGFGQAKGGPFKLKLTRLRAAQ